MLYLLYTRLFATGNNVTQYRYIQYLTRKYSWEAAPEINPSIKIR